MSHSTPPTQSSFIGILIGFLSKYPTLAGWTMFWIAVVVMVLFVIPVKENLGAVPVVVFATITLALYSLIWGKGDTGRRIAKSIAVLLLLGSIASFFLPKTYVNSIPSREMVGQKLVDRGILGGAWDGLKVAAFGKSATPTPSATQPSVAYTALREEARNIIRATTPAEISTNFRFNLEADGPIKVTYEDGQSYVYKPGECLVAPVPRSLGPKKFTDLNNPKGHINFRIYRLRSSEGGCNQ